MSQISYRTQRPVASGSRTVPAPLPTLQGVMYSSVDEFEALLEAKPHFAEGLTGLLSTLVGHECRLIGF